MLFFADVLDSVDMRHGAMGGQFSEQFPQEGDLGYLETNCHWKGCTDQFDTPDELVQVCPTSYNHSFLSSILVKLEKLGK